MKNVESEILAYGHTFRVICYDCDQLNHNRSKMIHIVICVEKVLRYQFFVNI